MRAYRIDLKDPATGHCALYSPDLDQHIGPFESISDAVHARGALEHLDEATDSARWVLKRHLRLMPPPSPPVLP